MIQLTEYWQIVTLFKDQQKSTEKRIKSLDPKKLLALDQDKSLPNNDNEASDDEEDINEGKSSDSATIFSKCKFYLSREVILVLMVNT